MVAIAPLPSVRVDAQRAAARGDIYLLLARCFRPPTPALLREATQAKLAETLSLALSALPLTWQPVGPALRQFEILPGRIGAATAEEAARRARMEYDRLFACATAPLASLCESGYVERDVEADGETPDHLADQLERVAALCMREAEARSRGDDRSAGEAGAQRHALLAGHLSRWAPTVARLTMARAHHPLYVAAASLLWSVMEIDR